MSYYWNPKPLRPEPKDPLFKMEEAPTVVKALTPIQRQRQLDGTPVTVTGVLADRPADPRLTLDTKLNKGSLVEKMDERPKQPKQDPQDPISVVKSYMAFRKSKQEEANTMDKSLQNMAQALLDLAAKTGV